MTYIPDERCDFITIHYSATPVEQDFSAEDIDEMHRARGFKEIGYHLFIRKNGRIELGRDLSQPGRFEMGAHSKGENECSVGICYEGGIHTWDTETGRDTRTPAQTEAMIQAIDAFLERFGGDGTDETLGPVVRGHNEMPGAATQCPGFVASAWWKGVVNRRKIEAKKHWIVRLLEALLQFFQRDEK